MHMVDVHTSHSSVLDSETNLVMHCCNQTCNVHLAKYQEMKIIYVFVPILISHFHAIHDWQQ